MLTSSEHAADQKLLLERVRHIIFRAGGINSASRGQLAALASTHGLTMTELAALIRAVGAAEELAPASGWHLPATDVPRADQLVPEPPAMMPTERSGTPAVQGEGSPSAVRTHSRQLRVAAIAMLALASVLAVRLVVIVVGAIRAAPAVDAVIEAPKRADGTAITASEAAGLQSLSLPDPTGLDSRELFQALTNLDQQAFGGQPRAAQAIFDRAVTALSEQWMTLPPDLVEDVTVLLRDAIAAAGAQDLQLAIEMTDALLGPAQALVSGEPASDLEPSAIAFACAWASSVDTLRLPPDAERRVRALRTSLPREVTRRPVEGEFWRGASVGLERLALEMVEQGAPAPSWDRLGDAAAALMRSHRAEGSIVLARAITHVLRDATAARSSAGRLAIASMMQRVDWREEVATNALLGWFDDRAVSSEQLSFVVRELVQGRAIPGLPAETRLDADADSAARTRVRDAFALSFGRPLRATDAFALRWRRASDELLAKPVVRGIGATRDAAMAAYLCAAAAQRVAGHDDAADEAVDRALAVMAAENQSDRSVGDPVRAGHWGESFLAARRDEQARLELLYLLMNEGGPATQLEADLLAETAAFGAPRSVQQLAQRIIIDLPDDWRLVDGLLKAMPLAASSNDGLAQVIERVTGRSLPPSGSDAWRTAVQQALAARWLELQSAERQAAFGDAPTLLADAYALRAATMRTIEGASHDVWSAPEAVVPESVAQDPAREGAALWGLWHQRVERLPEGQIAIAPLAELVARRSGRLALARGPIQRFAAEQASVAELIAYATAIEQPARAEAAATTVRSMRADGRSASSVYEQIDLAERAMLRLWRLRLGFEEDE